MENVLMRVRERTLSCLWIVAAALVLAWPAAAQTVKVGIILTLSGTDSGSAIQIRKGIDLYMQEHQKDLPPGVRLELVWRDDTGPNPEVAKRLAQELIVQERVQFLAGVLFTPNAAAIAPLTAEGKVPFVVMSAAGSALTRLSPYIVRVSTTLWQTSYPLGQWAARQGWKRAYIAVTDYAPGHDAQAAFTKAFTDAGGEIVGALRLPFATVDYVPFIQRVKDSKPEVAFVFVPGGKQATALMKAWGDVAPGARQQRINLVTTQDTVTDEELPNMGDVPLGVVSSGVYSAVGTTPGNRRFIEAWLRANGGAVNANYNAVFGWDGMAAIFDVIERTKAKFTGDEAMAILRGWETANSPRGTIQIDPGTRDIVQEIAIRRVQKLPDGTVANVPFETMGRIKDPWKEFNPVR
jgi:branched-chain amino acid transport system substrate-binding protein